MCVGSRLFPYRPKHRHRANCLPHGWFITPLYYTYEDAVWSVTEASTGRGKRMYFKADPSISGSCHIKLESAGSAASSDVFVIVPSNVRELAALVIQKCVVDKRGSGGFVTAGIDHMVRYFGQPTTHFHDPYRKPSLLNLKMRTDFYITGMQRRAALSSLSQ